MLLAASPSATYKPTSLIPAAVAVAHATAVDMLA